MDPLFQHVTLNGLAIPILFWGQAVPLKTKNILDLRDIFSLIKKDQKEVILNFTMAEANIHERNILPELTANYKGMTIANKGLIRSTLRQEFREIDLSLQTPLKNNMKDTRPK
ncbi:hypothetical protein P618_200484 [Holospora obtusa F1]|uniref:Transposase DDE domain-containing protein n=2 Tax=Holospora obtusa TaxID=49893 RepID=W6TE08_HOLOB|nr:hypothetical protein P618_200484 [Holospora obtusa F1]